MKFNSTHDEYLWEGSVVSGVVTGSGNVEAPTGWFAPINLEPDLPESPEERAALEHFGTRWLILHESNEGFVTVLTFDEEIKRDQRINELEQAYALYEAEISPTDAVEILSGYRESALFTAVDTRGESLDGRGFGWSQEAQIQMREEVLEFVTSNIESIREWRQETGHSWLQVGIDFWLTRNKTSAGYHTREGARAVGDDLAAAAHYWPEQTVVIDGNGELSIVSQPGTERGAS